MESIRLEVRLGLAFVLATALTAGCGGGGGHADGGGKDARDAALDSAEGRRRVCLPADANPTVALGDACGCDSDCLSGHCADGVCCATACTGKCMSCGLPGSQGTCAAVPAGAKPADPADCPMSAATSCGQDGTCDGNGGCSLYDLGTVCSDSKCSGPESASGSVCDGAGACRPAAEEVCFPYACKAGKCQSECKTNEDCSVGHTCSNGSCGMLPTGRGPCKNDGDCVSGHCADNVCCNVACSGDCLSCNQTGFVGQCRPIRAGLPHPKCVASAKSSCGETGVCDGFGSCALYPPDTECVPPTCVGGVINMTAGTCDGLGACLAPSEIDCTPFTCSGVACASVCKVDKDCVPPNVCMNGSCGKKPQGSPCQAAGECQSNFCVDNVCCDSACSGACQTCGLKSAPGHCSNVAVGQSDPHGKCKDMGATSCGTNGKCDGNGSCQPYPPDTICAGEKCMNGAYTPPSTCNASGQCLPPASRTCYPFACNGSKCYSVCGGAVGQCVSPNTCVNGSCGLKPIGASCSAASECVYTVDGKQYCAQGVCCNSACTDACHACNVAGAVGVCSAVPNGQGDPQYKCVAKGAASCGTNGKCQNGACDVYHTSEQCRPASCSGGAAEVLASYCDGKGGACPAASTQSCGSYACNTGTGTCRTSCGSDADCISPNTCNNNSCGKKPNGAACSAATQCSSGNCTEGVCCNTTCTDATNGTCQSCKVSGHVGTCTPVPNGGSDPNARCAATASTSCGLDGACDGSGKCRYWGTSTGCRNQSCSGITLTNAANCNGAGACQALSMKSCDPLVCDAAGTTCKTTCTSSADCNKVSCNTQNNQCGVTLPAGKTCGVGTDCASGFCAKTASGGGVCCNSACNTPASCSATQGVGASYCSASGSCQLGTPVAIDDNNVCTTDSCDPTTGQVTHANNTAACGAASCAGGVGTTAGTCSGGSCKGSVTATIDDKNPCTADACAASGVVTHAPVADGTSCSDGNPCNGVEACQSGVCKAGTPLTCKASDLCHTAGVCDPATGACSNPAKALTCTASDKCHTAGVCDPGTGTCTNPVKPLTCTASDACHTAGVCDPTTGACTNPAKAITCTASDACHTAGVCDPTTGGCTNPVKNLNCKASDKCHMAGVCDPTSGTCTDPEITCAASDQCHLAGTCDPKNGKCSNPEKTLDCSASDSCHVAGKCDPSTGGCTNPNAADGTKCDDGNACTSGEACKNGSCAGGTTKACPDPGKCHKAGSCDKTSGICSNPADTGASCSNGDSCVTGETCNASGDCTGGTTKTCDAPDECHDATQCQNGTCPPNPAKPDGTLCNAGAGVCCAGACSPMSCSPSP